MALTEEQKKKLAEKAAKMQTRNLNEDPSQIGIDELQEIQKMFCKYCGNVIDVDSKFCPFCGKELNGQMPQQVFISSSSEGTTIQNASVPPIDPSGNAPEQKASPYAKLFGWVVFLSLLYLACMTFNSRMERSYREQEQKYEAEQEIANENNITPSEQNAQPDEGDRVQSATEKQEQDNSDDANGESAGNEDAEEGSLDGEPKDEVEEELVVIDYSDALAMTPEQLFNNREVLDGMKIDTVVTLSDVSGNTLKSDDIDDDDLFFDFVFEFDGVNNLNDVYHEGQVVEILGCVRHIGLDMYSYEHCQVVCIDDEAGSRRNDINAAAGQTQEKIDALKTESQQRAAEELSVSKEEYASECVTLGYEDVMRNPSSYKDVKCVVSGSVIQVSEGWFDTVTMRVAEDGNSDKCWYVTFHYSDDASHFLENDWVTIYGECDGTETYTALLGNSVTIPSVRAEYIDATGYMVIE